MKKPATSSAVSEPLTLVPASERSIVVPSTVTGSAPNVVPVSSRSTPCVQLSAVAPPDAELIEMFPVADAVTTPPRFSEADEADALHGVQLPVSPAAPDESSATASVPSCSVSDASLVPIVR